MQKQCVANLDTWKGKAEMRKKEQEEEKAKLEEESSEEDSSEEEESSEGEESDDKEVFRSYAWHFLLRNEKTRNLMRGIPHEENRREKRGIDQPL